MKKIINIIKIIVMVVLVNINHFSTAGSTLEPALSFKKSKSNKEGEVKPRLTIAERINRIPEDNFQVCGGIPKNNKVLNSPEALNGRLILSANLDKYIDTDNYNRLAEANEKAKNCKDKNELTKMMDLEDPEIINELVFKKDEEVIYSDSETGLEFRLPNNKMVIVYINKESTGVELFQTPKKLGMLKLKKDMSFNSGDKKDLISQISKTEDLDKDKIKEAFNTTEELLLLRPEPTMQDYKPKEDYNIPKVYYIEENIQEFQRLLKTYDNDIISIYDDKILDYRNNSENLFYGVLYSLSTGLGLSSQQININDDAGKGKTKYKQELFNIIPNGYDIGSLSEKALYYISDSTINKMVIYCNDKGLETEKQQEETQVVRGMIREAITDNRIIRQKVNNDKDGIDTLITEIDAITLINTELHTKEGYKTGEQFTSVTEIININPLSYDEYLDIQLLIQDPENITKTTHFKELHKQYCQYLIDNYNEPILTKATFRGITDSNYSHRENTRRIAYYKTYCHYFNYDANDMHSIKKWNEFYKHYDLPSNVLLTFEVLSRYFTPVDLDTISPNQYYEHQLTQTPVRNSDGFYVNSKTTKVLHFFTVDNIKSYLTPLSKKNGKLYHYRDNMNDILQQLVKHGYLSEISTGESRKLYYIPKEDHS